MRKTFKDVQKVFTDNNATIEKEGRANRYIINGEIKVYAPKIKMNDIIEFVEKSGVEKFVNKFEEKSKVDKRKEAEKEFKKTTNKDKGLKSVIAKLDEECTAITLKILALDKEEKHTEKHLKLREELHKVYMQLEDYGAVRMITRKTA